MAKIPLDVNAVQALDPDLKKLLTELISKQLSYEALRFYSGKVVNNNDPEKLGRCKIRVFGIYDDTISDADLPWALPDDHFVGSFRGSMVIPPKDALVRVYFDHGDIYAPVYTSKIPEKKYKSEHIDKDYPDTILFFETDNGDYFTINKKKSEVTFHSAGGALIRIDNKGNITIDTVESDVLYGGAFKININGDVNMKSIGNVTIDAVGSVDNVPMINPFETPDPTQIGGPKTAGASNFNIRSTGGADILALGDRIKQTEELPNPTDPIALQMAALSKFKTGAINIIAANGDVNVNALTGKVIVNALTDEIDLNALTVKINATEIDLGKTATDGLIKSNAFTSFFDAHTHGGPGSPPVIPMVSQSATLVSQIVKTA